MAIQPGKLITAADVNQIIDTIEVVYATGQGDYGYGQSPFVAQDVIQKNKISYSDWARLRGMLLVCSNHQGTSNTSLFADPSVGAKIMASASTLTIAVACGQNRLRTAADATTVFDDVADASYGSTWNGVLQLTVDVSFVTEDQARFFFNSGGVVEINLTHPAGTTAQDNSFRAFLARQLGTFYISAHAIQITGTATATTVQSAGYYELPATDTLIVKQLSTSYLSTKPDAVEIHLQRTGYAGLNGANGTGFQAVFYLTFMGDVNGSVLTAGTSVDVDMVKATKYLAITSPNYAVSGFHQISTGNQPPNNTPSNPSNPSNPGTVQTIAPFDPTPGTVNYTVPDYATITFELMGGGGSQGSSTGPWPRTDGATVYLAAGTDGEDATVEALGLTAKGGKGGGTYNVTSNAAGPVGADGVGTGGDVNTTGGGAGGGFGRYASMTNYLNGSAGGSGAYVKKTYVRGAADAPNPGDVLVLTVPLGGSQSGITVPSNVPTEFFPGADGMRGQVKVTITQTTSGSASFQTPGTYSFSIPSYTSITFDVKGAGGGQAHPFNYHGNFDHFINGSPIDATTGLALQNGSPGGASSVTDVGLIANGGGGGTYLGVYNTALRPLTPVPGLPGLYSDEPPRVTAVGGPPGTASGGQQNATGGGAAGGYTLYFGDPTTAAAAGITAQYWAEGGNGGNGGRGSSTFAATDGGAPIAGAVVTVTVGAGGPPAVINPGEYAYGYVYATGQNGSVNINWVGTTTSVDTPA